MIPFNVTTSFSDSSGLCDPDNTALVAYLCTGLPTRQNKQ